MRTFKKIIAVLVTLSMLLGAVALTANAGEFATVKLVGRTQLEVEDTYSVDLVVSSGNGGVQGTISYDTTALEYIGVDFSDDFVAANKGIDNLVKEANGQIAFIGLNPGNDGTWFTLNFKALDTVNTNVNVGDGVIDLMISTIDGKEIIGSGEGTTLVNLRDVEIVTKNQVNTMGGSIKGTGDATKQDIRFVTNIDYKGENAIQEYGVIFLPAKLLNGQELVADPTFDYDPSDAKTVKAAIATYTGENLGKQVQIVASLTGSASFKMNSLLTVDFVSRSYIKLADGTILYSNNDGGASGAGVDNGYATKSIASVAIRMAEAVIVNPDLDADDKTALEGILANKDDISNAQVKALLEILVKPDVFELIPNNK